MCKAFANQMKSEFEMSMLGEMNLFLGLQITQTKKGIFISQTKYVKEFVGFFPNWMLIPRFPYKVAINDQQDL